MRFYLPCASLSLLQAGRRLGGKPWAPLRPSAFAHAAHVVSAAVFYTGFSHHSVPGAGLLAVSARAGAEKRCGKAPYGICLPGCLQALARC